MWVGLGFCMVLLAGALAAALLARRRPAQLGPMPWNPLDFARGHLVVMGSLAGFSVTGIVILIALNRVPVSPEAQVQMETVVVALFVAFVFCISTAFLMTYLPPPEAEGGALIRLHLSLASTLEYRTIFLSWFALLLLFAAHGLTLVSWTLGMLLPVSLLTGSVIIAMVADGFGLVRAGEAFAGLAAGAGLAGAGIAAAALLPPTPLATLVVVLAISILNGASFMLIALTPLGFRHPRLGTLLARHGRWLAAADLHWTGAAQIWLAAAVLGFV